METRVFLVKSDSYHMALVVTDDARMYKIKFKQYQLPAKMYMKGSGKRA